MISNERDIDFINKIICQSHEHEIHSDYGDKGISDFICVIDNIRRIYKCINLRNHNSIIIFKSDSINLKTLHNQTHVINDFSHLTIYETCPNLTIQIKKIDEIILSTEDIDISQIIPTNFVYQYISTKERFYTKTKTYELDDIPDCESYFSIPTFKSLESALEHYKINIVRSASCPHMQEALHPQRIFFKPKPEKYLRRSLEFFLKIRMREYIEVRPEQIVDESHPVDLKISWQGINHIALIEIKWLGKSLDAENGTITSIYDEPRALKGADQLIGYLDSNRERVPSFNTQGYLIIYDIRRKNTNANITSIDRDNGFFYEHKEINFNPSYHTTRNDFTKPIRMFITPQCNVDGN